MNNRTRQWFNASAWLDRIDLQLLAVVPDIKAKIGKVRRCLIFRRSELAKMRNAYGDDLKVIIGDDGKGGDQHE